MSSFSNETTERIIERATNRLPVYLCGVKYVPEERVHPHPVKAMWLPSADAVEIFFDRKSFGLKDEHVNRFVMEPELASELEDQIASALRRRARETA